MLDTIISILASPLSFLILISVVITVHELGHYWVGRMFGAAVESFAIGFGKPIFEIRDKRGTRWRVNWLPLGGFVKFVGEMQTPADSKSESAGPVGKAYPALGPLKRLAVSLGGPLANFIFAILIFAALGMGLGTPEADEVRVVRVEASSPAESAGFQAGDIIRRAGGNTVYTSHDVTRATFLRSGEAVAYSVLRDGQPLEIVATPVERQEHNVAFGMVERVGRIGLALEDRDIRIRHLGPIESMQFGVKTTGDALSSTLTVLRRLVTGQDGLDKMSGPVGIFDLTDRVTDMHMKQEGVEFSVKFRQLALRLLELAALLSIGVGFFNLLPIPVLDGGAAVMCLAEAATGKEIPERVQRVGLTIGLACLISFALVITWQDVNKLPWWPGGP